MTTFGTFDIAIIMMKDRSRDKAHIMHIHGRDGNMLGKLVDAEELARDTCWWVGLVCICLDGMGFGLVLGLLEGAFVGLCFGLESGLLS